MKQRQLDFGLLLLLLPMPLCANNVPTPDGTLGYIMLFVAVILARRWGKVLLPPVSTEKRAAAAIGLGLCCLVSAVGTGFAFFAMIVLLCYGIVRGVEVIRLGQGVRRWLAGMAVIMFTLLVTANYVVAATSSPIEYREVSAESRLRAIARAESAFAAANATHQYGTLEQLKQQDLLDVDLADGERSGYSIKFIADGEKFFAVASPIMYEAAPSWIYYVTPSLMRAFWTRTWTTHTFAIDETGIPRKKDLGGSRPVNREEFQTWP